MAEQLPTFIVSDERSPQPARQLRQSRLLLGSDPGCDIRLRSQRTVSRHHACLTWRAGRFYLTDIDEANATVLNHRTLFFDEEEALADGDMVQIGPYLLELKCPTETTLRVEVSRLLVSGTYVIKRTDLTVEKRIERDGLRIGSDNQDCHLCLNNLNVSPLHAGINRIRDRCDPSQANFYLTDLTLSNSTLLNDRLLITDEPAVLASGDKARIGPYVLTFGIEGETLSIEVSLHTTSDTREGVGRGHEEPPRPPTAGGAFVSDALRIFWAKRTREKAARPSPLHPRPQERPGKARFLWRPTTDLTRPWPFALLLWVLLSAGALLWLAAKFYASAYEPLPLSAAHSRALMSMRDPVALRANADACDTCHQSGRDMNEQCAACHQSEAFVATVTPPHRAAGVGCVNCHAEHRGAEFRPGVAPLSADLQPAARAEETCAGCHSDANHKLYGGRAVHTPHGGTLGYPVSRDGVWLWRGLDAEEWAQQHADVKRRYARWETVEQQPASAQFHALHLGRVRARGGLQTDETGQLICSSCHKSWGATLDRETPRSTCAVCHNGRTDAQTGRALVTADRPDCASCHLQHVRDRRREGVARGAAAGSGF